MKVKFLHVCATCGKPHCGCPDPTEHHGVSGGFFTLDRISHKVNDDVEDIEKGICSYMPHKDTDGWPVVIGTIFEGATD